MQGPPAPSKRQAEHAAAKLALDQLQQYSNVLTWPDETLHEVFSMPIAQAPLGPVPIAQAPTVQAPIAEAPVAQTPVAAAAGGNETASFIPLQAA